MLNFEILDRHLYNTYSDPTGEFSDIKFDNGKLFPTRQDIYDIHTKLRCEEFVDGTLHLTDIMRNQ